MRLTIVSDTHGLHRSLPAMSGDVLIHCGDLFNRDNRSPAVLDDLDSWFGKQDFERIFCIGGNHDFLIFEESKKRTPLFCNAEYLQDALIQHHGVTFYASPWVPDLSDWAYYASEKDILAAWQKTPTGIDVLITHTPPFGILDMTTGGQIHAGCKQLASELTRIRPKLHCFGHIHASYGVEQKDATTFINASAIGRELKIKNPPLHVILER